MSTPRRLFRLPLTRARLDDELREEFRFHIEERIEQFMAEGMTHADAAREVERRFGNYEMHHDLTRRIDEDTMQQRRRSDFFRTLVREAGIALRALRRSPGFALIAFTTLTLGIGATTAIYTVLDAVVLRPLAYREPDQLVSVLHPATVPGSGERKWGLSPGGYFEFKTKNRTLDGLGLFRNTGLVVTNGGAAEMTQVAMVTSTVFPVLKARAQVGRLITDADDAPGAPQVVVLSHEFLQRRFGGDESMVGRMLETSGGAFEIVGVAEPGLGLPIPGPFASSANLAGFGVDVWMPMQLNPNGPFYNNHPYVGVGRLKAGMTPDSAQRDLEPIFAKFPDVMPSVYSPGFIKQYNFRVEAAALRDAVLGPKIPRVLWLIFGAVLLVLLIAAANVSNLFMVRTDSRRQEAALRRAIGADRIQMTAHFLAEPAIICIAAAAAGVLLAAVSLRALLVIAPTDIPRLAHVALSWRATGVAFAVALVLALLLGLLPLLRREIDLGVLREGGRGLSASPRQRVARSGLVIGQVALALVLLSAAGLMLRSFDRLRGVQPGFDPSNVLTFEVSLPYTDYKTREDALVFHREFDRRLRDIAGVTAVGATGTVPLEGYGTGCSVVFRENRPYAVGEQTPCVATPTAGPGFFDALRIPVLGRTPTWSDIDARTQAVVVTKALADRLWPGEDPIGKGIGSNGWQSKVWYRVVGVVPEMRAEALDLPPTEAVFYAMTGLRANAQTGDLNDLSYMVRTDGIDPLTLTARVREILKELNPSVPLIDARTMDAVVERSLARASFLMVLLGIAASVALVLSAVGMYGVISYVVTQRRSEIGIRMALGASIGQVVRLVMLHSVLLAAAGVVIGLAGTFSVNRLMGSMLFEVSPTDPVVLAATVVLLLVIATVASAGPARRAARIDPAETMRGG